MVGKLMIRRWCDVYLFADKQLKGMTGGMGI